MEINEIQAKLNGDIYKHCALYSAQNKVIVPYNGQRNKINYVDNGKKIINLLNNPELLDGTYIVKCKQVYQGGNIDEFFYQKGNKQTNDKPMNNNSSSALNLPHDFAEAMQHPAIKLQTEITRLELENEDLNRQIEELNEYVQELESKISTQQLAEIPTPPSALETAKGFLTELATMAAPLIDQHYQLKAQALEIERQKLNKPQPQQYRTPEVAKELNLEQKIKAWINSKNHDTELFNNLTAIYYNSADIQKFAELLNEFNPEIYENCKQAIR